MDVITSLQNESIKNIIKLSDNSRYRKDCGLFVVEGVREVGLALAIGYEVNQLFICEEVFDGNWEKPSKSFVIDGNRILEYDFAFDPKVIKIVNRAVFNKMAYRESTGGVIATFKSKYKTFDDVKLKKNSLVVVVESVEKPGNLGAILRTCDASNVDLLIICNPLADIFNPNVIRSSIGCVFTTNIVTTDNESALAWLKHNNIKCYAAALTDKSQPYHTFDFKGSGAFIMGTEAYGLSNFWLENSDEQVVIPMRGKIDSLNVATATAILIFEAMRQRNFK